MEVSRYELFLTAFGLAATIGVLAWFPPGHPGMILRAVLVGVGCAAVLHVWLDAWRRRTRNVPAALTDAPVPEPVAARITEFFYATFLAMAGAFMVAAMAMSWRSPWLFAGQGMILLAAVVAASLLHTGGGLRPMVAAMGPWTLAATVMVALAFDHHGITL